MTGARRLERPCLPVQLHYEIFVQQAAAEGRAESVVAAITAAVAGERA